MMLDDHASTDQRKVYQHLAKTQKGKPRIAPLRLPTLASYQTWGDSVGAGRTGLPTRK